MKDTTVNKIEAVINITTIIGSIVGIWYALKSVAPPLKASKASKDFELDAENEFRKDLLDDSVTLNFSNSHRDEKKQLVNKMKEVNFPDYMKVGLLESWVHSGRTFSPVDALEIRESLSSHLLEADRNERLRIEKIIKIATGEASRTLALRGW